MPVPSRHGSLWSLGYKASTPGARGEVGVLPRRGDLHRERNGTYILVIGFFELVPASPPSPPAATVRILPSSSVTVPASTRTSPPASPTGLTVPMTSSLELAREAQAIASFVDPFSRVSTAYFNSKGVTIPKSPPKILNPPEISVAHRH